MTAISRHIFIRSQQVRVTITIDGSHYTLKGVPANQPEQDDEVVEAQSEIMKIYEDYGIYYPNVIDRVAGLVESQVAPLIRRFWPTKPWERSGELQPRPEPK